MTDPKAVIGAMLISAGVISLTLACIGWELSGIRQALEQAMERRNPGRKVSREHHL